LKKEFGSSLLIEDQLKLKKASHEILDIPPITNDAKEKPVATVSKPLPATPEKPARKIHTSHGLREAIDSWSVLNHSSQLQSSKA
jgi:hypothetical protein